MRRHPRLKLKSFAAQTAPSRPKGRPVNPKSRQPDGSTKPTSKLEGHNTALSSALNGIGSLQRLEPLDSDEAKVLLTSFGLSRSHAKK